MLIETKEQYEKIPDGTILKIVLLGDSWGEDTGTVDDCIKLGDKLYENARNYYLFSERNEKSVKDEDDYTFAVIKMPGKQYEI